MTHREFNPQDHYNKAAKQREYVARSIYKLKEIDDKYHLLHKKVTTVLDIGCSPGSWLQYVHQKVGKNPGFIALGVDIQPVKVSLEGVHTYVADATDHNYCLSLITGLGITSFDCIVSDLAPHTIGFKDIDAMRCIGVLEGTLWLYEQFLKPGGTFVMKIFMGPGFDEFVAQCKKIRGATTIKLVKPKACRDMSKEIYIVKWR